MLGGRKVAAAACIGRDRGEKRTKIEKQARVGEQKIKLKRETCCNMKSSNFLQEVKQNYNCKVNVKDMNQQFIHSYVIEGQQKKRVLKSNPATPNQCE